MSLSYRIDFSSLERCVERLRPRSALVVLAPGLFGLAGEVAGALAKLGVQAILSSSPSYGTCDLHISEMHALQADAVVNVGHYWSGPELGRVCFVNVEFVFNPDEEAEALLGALKEVGASEVAAFTISSYISLTKELIRRLEEGGVRVRRPKGIPGHWDYEVLGCNYLPAYSAGAGLQLFIGNSWFHAIGLYLSTERRTLMFDPESMKLTDVRDEAERALRASLLRISVASTKERFGVVLGLKEGQLNPMRAKMIADGLRRRGKEVMMISAYEITPDSLEAFAWPEAFVETACPRIPMTDTGYRRPLLSYPEGLGLLRLLSGREVGNPYRMAVMY